jgi:hypothetical protein
MLCTNLHIMDSVTNRTTIDGWRRRRRTMLNVAKGVSKQGKVPLRGHFSIAHLQESDSLAAFKRPLTSTMIVSVHEQARLQPNAMLVLDVSGGSAISTSSISLLFRQQQIRP